MNTECEGSEDEGEAGGGFSAFSFLAMVVSVTNLVSLLHSSANNNLNNNNDNNNINNDNIQAGNEDNNNNNLNLLTMVTFGGRRRRHLQPYASSSSSLSHAPAGDLAAGVGVLFLRAWRQVTILETKSSTNLTSLAMSQERRACVRRALCEANSRSAELGRLGEDVAEVLRWQWRCSMAGWRLLLAVVTVAYWCCGWVLAAGWLGNPATLWGRTQGPGAWDRGEGHLEAGHSRSKVLGTPWQLRSHLPLHLKPHPGPLLPRGNVPPTALPQEVMDALPGAISKVMETYGRAPFPAPTTTEPPVIWFPNQEEECTQAQGGGGGGFSTFSLLALLVSVVNLVGLVASNAENNLNSNNNDNNINNNVLQAGNEDNANNNANVFTMITTGAGKKRKRKRGVEEEVCWLQEEETVTGEEVAGVVAMAFLRSYLQAALAGGRRGCVVRSVCQAHSEAAEWGEIAVTLARGMSVAHVEWVAHVSPGVSRLALLGAAEKGRDGEHCGRLYRCPSELWANLTQHHALTHALSSLMDSRTS